MDDTLVNVGMRVEVLRGTIIKFQSGVLDYDDLFRAVEDAAASLPKPYDFYEAKRKLLEDRWNHYNNNEDN